MKNTEEFDTKIYERKFPALIGKCEEVKEFARKIASNMKFTELEIFQIELALDEAFINAADHGTYCSASDIVNIKLICDNDKLTIVVKDFGGRPFNPTFFEKIADRKSWGVGGRGIKIIKEIMDEVMYIFLDGKSTTLYMTKIRKK